MTNGKTESFKMVDDREPPMEQSDFFNLRGRPLVAYTDEEIREIEESNASPEVKAMMRREVALVRHSESITCRCLHYNGNNGGRCHFYTCRHDLSTHY